MEIKHYYPRDTWGRIYCEDDDEMRRVTRDIGKIITSGTYQRVIIDFVGVERLLVPCVVTFVEDLIQRVGLQAIKDTCIIMNMPYLATEVAYRVLRTYEVRELLGIKH